jgi:5-oxoprolinase (ATP-hydrolysing) subunit A
VSATQWTVDLNADLGESFGVWRLGDDEQMLALITSANVACGFHAGDPAGLARTCRVAADRGVRIGAQVGYRDLAGFGRRYIDVAAEDLIADVIYQIGALQALAHAAGSTVSYVKPHGALYNTVVSNEGQARAVAAAVYAVDPALPVLGLAGSAMFEAAVDSGLRCVAEAFADRAYRPDGQLVSRREAGAVLADPREVAERGDNGRPRRSDCGRRIGNPDHRGIDMRAWGFAGRGPNCDRGAAATDRRGRRFEAVYLDRLAPV